MRRRLWHCFWVAFAVCVLFAVAPQAQINPFRGSGSRGLSPEDNQLLFESVARLNAAEPSQAGRFEAWSNPQTNSSGTSTVVRVFHWCGITSSSPDGHRVTTTASPGAAHRPGNGRLRADPPQGGLVSAATRR